MSGRLLKIAPRGTIKAEMARPRVATLMAVYGRERPEFLRESIESLLCQTYRFLDIHIFEDGPLGENLSCVLKEYASSVSNLYLHRGARRRGLAVCLNDLIVLLKDRYAYFARMDSDDISLPERIEKQTEFLEAHPEIDVVGGGVIDMDERGLELKRVCYPAMHEEVVAFFRKRNPMAHVTVMYRRSFFERAGLYPPISLEDGLYWMQGILSGCRFQNLPDALVRVRRTDDFLKRRSGFRKCWEEFKIKVIINHRLKLGMTSYLYAAAMLGVQLMPLPIKKILYNRLR